jgi:hypothetical protein
MRGKLRVNIARRSGCSGYADGAQCCCGTRTEKAAAVRRIHVFVVSYVATVNR